MVKKIENFILNIVVLFTGFFGVFFVTILPSIFIWMLILAYFPKAYKLAEYPLCNDGARISIQVEGRMVDYEDDDGGIYKQEWEEETNIYCQGNGKKKEVSWQGWFFLSGISALILSSLTTITTLIALITGPSKKTKRKN